MSTATQKKGLGKGLGALMSEEYSSYSERDPNALPIDQLESGKYQPRLRFDETYLKELSISIAKNGIMQPILVRKPAEDKTKYEIIAGERRWRAARLAGLDEVPVIIKEIDDRQALELALVENIQRQDLSPVEEARGYQRLIDEFSYTQEELANTVGKSRSYIANMLRLLNLPERVRYYLDEDKISAGHARALLNSENADGLVEEVVSRGLNVRQTENLCRGGLPASSRPRGGQGGSSGQSQNYNAPKDADIVALEESLSEALGIKVVIDDRGSSGSVALHYDSLKELDDILKRLGGGGQV